MKTSHVDTFARDNLPPLHQRPEYVFDLPELTYSGARELRHRAPRPTVTRGRRGRAVALRRTGRDVHIRRLFSRAPTASPTCWCARWALEPGNRVLLRGTEQPDDGRVLVRGDEGGVPSPWRRCRSCARRSSSTIIGKAKVTHALCDARLLDELRAAAAQAPLLSHVVSFNDASADGLEARMTRQPETFDNVPTRPPTTSRILAFTSGTTGVPKATMHFHRDVMAVCKCFPPHVLRARADDLFAGSPPLAFTFGLGGLLLFPMSIGASTLLWSVRHPRRSSMPSLRTAQR